jgi:hypothetical protein
MKQALGPCRCRGDGDETGVGSGASVTLAQLVDCQAQSSPALVHSVFGRLGVMGEQDEGGVNGPLGV